MKKFILVIVTILLILAGLGGSQVPAPSDEDMKQNVTSFDLKTSQFYDEFVVLQIERVRLAKMAQEGQNITQLLDQMEKIHKQAEKICHILSDLYLLASRIEKGEETAFIPSFLATPVLAKEKHGLVGTILLWTPIIGRLVEGYDQVSEGIRLGVYKTYQRTMKEGEPVDKKEIKKTFEEAGFSKPEDIFSCDPEELRQFYRHHYSEFREEVDLAKIAAKTGEKAVLAYIDGILAATSGDMPTPDIPGDLEGYLKMVLGKETVKEHLAKKLKGAGFELLEESVAGLKKPQEKVTIAVKNEVENIVTGVLTGQTESSQMPPVEARTGMIAGEIQPYEDWTTEEKRAVALKVNEIEEPLVVVTKTETEETTNRLFVPEGEWDVLSSVEGTAPVLVEDAKVEEDAITQIVRMAVTAGELVENYAEGMEELSQSRALAPGEVWDWESWEVEEEPEPSEIEEEPEEVPATARGKLLTDRYLEGWKKALVGQGCVVNWIREGENHLSLSFDLAGGEVTGSYTWQYSFQYGIPDGPTYIVTKRQTVNLTGTYSGGKTGTFQGELAGSGTDTIRGGKNIDITVTCKTSGTWSADMTSSGQISGLLKYTLRYPEAVQTEEFEFTASLVS